MHKQLLPITEHEIRTWTHQPKKKFMTFSINDQTSYKCYQWTKLHIGKGKLNDDYQITHWKGKAK